jgi:hypothetical protein
MGGGLTDRERGGTSVKSFEVSGLDIVYRGTLGLDSEAFSELRLRRKSPHTQSGIAE